VMPTHIGAERIAELILFPETARLLRSSEKMSELERTLRHCGLDMEVVTVPEHGAVTGRSVAEIETMAKGKFFILQVERKDGNHISNPEQALKVHAGDGVVIVGRRSEEARSIFDAPAKKFRAGRTTF